MSPGDHACLQRPEAWQAGLEASLLGNMPTSPCLPPASTGKRPLTLHSEWLTGIPSLFKGCQMPAHRCHIHVLMTCPKNPWSKRSRTSLRNKSIMVKLTALNFAQHSTACKACLRQQAVSVLSLTGTLRGWGEELLLQVQPPSPATSRGLQ